MMAPSQILISVRRRGLTDVLILGAIGELG